MLKIRQLLNLKLILILIISIVLSIFGYIKSENYFKNKSEIQYSSIASIKINFFELSQLKKFNLFSEDIGLFSKNIWSFYQDEKFWANYSTVLRDRYADSLIGKIETLDNLQLKSFEAMLDKKEIVNELKYEFLELNVIRSIILDKIYFDLNHYNKKMSYKSFNEIKISEKFKNFDKQNDIVIYEIISKKNDDLVTFKDYLTRNIQDSIRQEIKNYIKKEISVLESYHNRKIEIYSTIIKNNYQNYNQNMINIINSYSDFSKEEIKNSLNNLKSDFFDYADNFNLIEVEFDDYLIKKKSYENFKYLVVLFLFYLPFLIYFLVTKNYLYNFIISKRK